MHALLMMTMISSVAFAQIVTLTTDHEEFLFNVHPEETISEIIEQASPFLGDDDLIILEISRKRNAFKFWDHQARNQGQYLGYPRNYEAGISREEKGYIHYIITTLANKTLVTIAKSRTELENAGDRIDHVHPLHFLRTVFTDEELKVGIRNIRGKGWVWHSFTAGLKDTLSTELDIGNIKEEYVIDFAQAVELNPNIIRPFIQARNWDGLIDALINEIPRKNNDRDRYDC